jgi:nucleoside-diphosphate-sugar epimerase
MQIAVVGCGWLGLPLGLSLQKSGHSIVATVRSEAGCAKIRSLGFTCLQFELGDTLADEKLLPIFNSDLLILNIPIGRKTASSEAFTANMHELLRQAVDSEIKQVIFVSTTSVFGDQSAVFTEKSVTHPNTQSGKINLLVEQLVQKYFASQASILRLAGLVGEDRHPVNYLAGKTELAAPNRVVNLVHQEDVIQSIECIIKNRIWGHTLILSATEHPSRQDYYTWAAQQLSLTAPRFIEELGQPRGKLIDASASLGILKMHLKYPSPYDMLN